MAAGEKFRMLVADALARSGKGVLAFEMEHGLKPSSIKAIVSPALRQTPSIDKAEMIARALGLEFYIGPPRAAQDQDAPPPLPPRLCARLHLPDGATEADALAAIDLLSHSGHRAMRIAAVLKAALPAIETQTRAMAQALGDIQAALGGDKGSDADGG